MRIVLLRPFGRYEPGTVVDIDPTMAQVMVREGFVRRASDPAPDARPKAPTVAELRAYATANGLTTGQARQRLADEAAHRSDPLAPPTTEEAPCA